jgi:hydroxylamine reductase
MFCYQCEQTAKGTGCDKSGVCGKKPEVAALHDLLIYCLEGLSMAAVVARRAGIDQRDANVFVCKALFSTLTNVNFDPERFMPMIGQAVAWRDKLIAETAGTANPMDVRHEALQFQPATDLEGLVARGRRRASNPFRRLTPISRPSSTRCCSDSKESPLTPITP